MVALVHARVSPGPTGWETVWPSSATCCEKVELTGLPQMIPARARTEIAGGDVSLRLLTFEVAPTQGRGPVQRSVTVRDLC